MRHASGLAPVLTLVLALVLAIARPAAACDPTDARLDVFAAGDEVVFVDHEHVRRVRLDGRIVHEHALPDYGSPTILLSDQRTLLVLVPTDEESAEPCLAARWHVELFDTIEGGRTRRIGTAPRRPRGVEVTSVRQQADGRLIVGYASADGELAEEIVVGPTSRSIRPRPATEAPRDPAPSPAPAVVLDRSEDRLRVLDAAGRARVTIHAVDDQPFQAALTADGRHLALASYSSFGEDYGNGWEGRLEIVELATGAHRTAAGTGHAVARVEGTVDVACVPAVNDPRSPLNVRREPRARAEAVGTIPHGTPVTVAETRGRWARITAPLAGWVFGESLATRCTVR